MGEEKRFLQLGGLGGLLAGILPIVSLLLAVSLGFTGPGSTEELLRRFQDFGRAYLIFPGLSLAASLFAVTLFLALHRVSKTVSPVTAVVGAALGTSGALFAAANWGIIIIGGPFLADLHAAATGADRTTILIAAQAWEQVPHGFQFFGGLLIGLAFVSFGWALRARTDVQGGFGWVPRSRTSCRRFLAHPRGYRWGDRSRHRVPLHQRFRDARSLPPHGMEGLQSLKNPLSRIGGIATATRGSSKWYTRPPESRTNSNPRRRPILGATSRP